LAARYVEGSDIAAGLDARRPEGPGPRWRSDGSAARRHQAPAVRPQPGRAAWMPHPTARDLMVLSPCTLPTWQAVAPATTADAVAFYAECLALLGRSGLPYRLAGTHAGNAYTRMDRPVDGLDVFCRAATTRAFSPAPRGPAMPAKSRTTDGGPRPGRAFLHRRAILHRRAHLGTYAAATGKASPSATAPDRSQSRAVARTRWSRSEGRGSHRARPHATPSPQGADQ
jgi:hypothetical protein